MTDLTAIITKPVTIVPNTAGVPKMADNVLTPEGALVKTISTILQGTGQNSVKNQAILSLVQSTLLNQPVSNANAPVMINTVLKGLGVPVIDNVKLGQVLQQNGLNLPPFALNLVNNLGGTLALVADKWGIYTASGAVAIVVDTITQVGLNTGSKIASHPVQAGGFASFNKVHEPNKITLRLVKSGNKSNGKQLRTDFLNSLDKLKQGLDLLQIVTPNAIYKNMNVVSYNYRFDEGHATSMIVAEVSLEEVREVTVAYSTVQTPTNPDGSPAINQPQSVNAATPQSGGLTSPQPAQPDERNVVEKGADWFFGLFK